MIPLRDNAPRYSPPFITVTLIIINFLVFFYQLSLDPYGLEYFIQQNGVIPLRFAGFVAGRVPAGAALLPLFSSMFIHAGWLHIIGNMWFLWLFGDNVEDQLGHGRYLAFYLICGLLAGFVHIFFNINSRLPSVGASGAIAGVMGAYLILFPGAKVLTLVPFFLIFTIELPAWVMLLYWILTQAVVGVASLGAATTQTTGGVAVWAHVGGFFAGLALVKMWGRRPALRRYYEW